MLGMERGSIRGRRMSRVVRVVIGGGPMRGRVYRGRLMRDRVVVVVSRGSGGGRGRRVGRSRRVRRVVVMSG